MSYTTNTMTFYIRNNVIGFFKGPGITLTYQGLAVSLQGVGTRLTGNVSSSSSPNEFTGINTGEFVFRIYRGTELQFVIDNNSSGTLTPAQYNVRSRNVSGGITITAITSSQGNVAVQTVEGNASLYVRALTNLQSVKWETHELVGTGGYTINNYTGTSPIITAMAQGSVINMTDKRNMSQVDVNGVVNTSFPITYNATDGEIVNLGLYGKPSPTITVDYTNTNTPVITNTSNVTGSPIEK